MQLPSGLNGVIGLLGVRFPDANEDELNQLASQLEKFASALDSAQMAADKALTMLHEVYKGSSADRLSELWSTITKYSKVIVEACQTIAKVLRAAAVVIEVAKTQSIVQLFSIQASLAAASSTGPWSTAAVLRLGRELMNRLLSEAVSRLGHTLLQPIEDMIVKAAQHIVPTPANNSNGQGFNVDLAQVASCAADLRRGADDVESHGMDFKRIVSGLKMGGSGDPFGKLVIQVAQKILQTIAEDVLKRILGSFRDTAGKMDKLAGNLSENEDSNRMSLNGIGSMVANPLSPDLSTGTGLNSAGTPRIGGGGGSSDSGLAASFAALAPKLGPVGSSSSRGSSGNGVNTLGLKEPNLKGIGAALGGHSGGGGGGGGGVDSPGVGGAGAAGGFATRLTPPGGSGSKTGAMRLGTSLEGDHHEGVSGVGSGSGSGGGTGTSTAGLAGRPPMAGGMMGGMHMAGGGSYGPVGGSGIRGAQRRSGGGQGGNGGANGNGSENGENPADGVISDASASAAHSALQLGRVAPVRREPGEERAERDDRYDDDFDADLTDLPDFTEFSDPA
ncbi:WXG100-like domain-containing protein [Kitasatospora griseola]